VISVRVLKKNAHQPLIDERFFNLRDILIFFYLVLNFFLPKIPNPISPTPRSNNNGLFISLHDFTVVNFFDNLISVKY